MAFCLGYSAVSGALVSFGAPLAAGSGIPEIKTYLNGVHVRGAALSITACTAAWQAALSACMQTALKGESIFLACPWHLRTVMLILHRAPGAAHAGVQAGGRGAVHGGGPHRWKGGTLCTCRRAAVLKTCAACKGS